MSFLASSAADSVTDSPLTVQIVGIVGIIVAIATALPKIFGPLSQTWDAWLSGRRVRAQAKDDAEDADHARELADKDRRIAELEKSQTYRQGVIDAQRDELAERDRLAMAHMLFDYEWIQRLNPPLTEAIPSLFPQQRKASQVAATAAQNESESPHGTP